jgi:hydroxymethylglutaryl-CoA reductase
MLVKFGGGPRDVQARVVETPRGKMVIVHLLVDVRDAMGANAVNTMTEAISPELEKISGGKAVAKIISNLAVYRKARAKAVWKKEVLEESFNGQFKGEEIVERILDVWAFAAGDPFRAATHNKGVMNGIDSLAIATGNDFRAVEAGMHSFAATNSGNGYSPITKYEKTKEGDLLGSIELPIAMGTIGGATRTHPLAQVGLKILGAKNARELSMVAASLGLAQNFGALRAIATEGIQKGHMRLHAHNTAISVGATGEEVAIVAKRIADDGKVRVDYAKQVLEEIRGGK